METLFVVRYNVGEDTTLNVIVKNENDFKEWLENRNYQRTKAGFEEDQAGHFDLIPLQLYKNQ